MGKRAKEAKRKTDQQDRSPNEHRGGDWADTAAMARAADDPRRVAPHDQSGVPSTGDTR